MEKLGIEPSGLHQGYGERDKSSYAFKSGLRATLLFLHEPFLNDLKRLPQHEIEQKWQVRFQYDGIKHTVRDEKYIPVTVYDKTNGLSEILIPDNHILISIPADMTKTELREEIDYLAFPPERKDVIKTEGFRLETDELISIFQLKSQNLANSVIAEEIFVRHSKNRDKKSFEKQINKTYERLQAILEPN